MADLPGPVELLDAGVGRGVMSFYLLRAFPEMHATLVDVIENYGLGRHIFFPEGDPTHRYSYKHLNLHEQDRDTRYGLVLCMDVLEHIVFWRPVLHSLWEVVAPGGYLYAQTPANYPSPTYPRSLILRKNLKQRLNRLLPRWVPFDGVYHVRHGLSCKTLKDESDRLGARLLVAGEQYLPSPFFPPCGFKPRTSILMQKPR